MTDVVELELTADAATRERVLGVCARLGTFEHPNVRRVLGAREADGLLYVALEPADGEDLASLLAREGPLAPDRALEIVARAAEALDGARWARGIVHGGLDAGDVLVAADGRVLVSGFGVPGRRLAPEQRAGEPANARSDVYALGWILGECLPDPRLERVLAHARAASPEDRYSTCAELVAAARSALAGGAGEAPVARRPVPAPTEAEVPEPEALADPHVRPPRKRPALAAAAAATLLVVAVLTVGVARLARADTDASTREASAFPYEPRQARHTPGNRYLAETTAICLVATARFHEAMEKLRLPDGPWTRRRTEVFNRTAARFAEETLAKLRRVPRPRADRARIASDFRLREQELDVLRRIAVAAGAGDTALVERLGRRRVELTHKRASTAVPVGGAGGGLAQACPIDLPA